MSNASSSAGNTQSNSPDVGGVRLDRLTIDDRSDQGRSKSNPSTGRLSNAKLAGTSTAVNSPEFEVGSHPSGDVFSSPAKALPSSFMKDRAVTALGGGGARELAQVSQTLDTPYQPRLRSHSSNLASRHHVGGVDAQQAYPATACVFVANLPEPRDDASLEAAVTRIFSKFGTVYVKIRRDGNHMPFAFCQFTKDEDARAAYEQGRGLMILGRACRTEMAKANRTFLAYRSDERDITIDETQGLLIQYGPIKKLEILHPQLQEALKVPPAVVVEFVAFDPSRDLQSAFRGHPFYCVHPYDLKRNMTTSRPNADEQYLARYETDRRSVYVGNLAPGVEEDDLAALFVSIGEIKHIQLVRRPQNAEDARIFAFVEFAEPNMPDNAIEKYDSITFHGLTLRVERKVVKEQTPTNRRSMQQMGTYNSPRNRPSQRSPYTPAGYRGQRQSHAAAPNPSWTWITSSQPAPGYMPAPVSPYGAQPYPMQGTPQTPVGMNPYGYYPQMWPGMATYSQDPMAQMPSYYPYQSPAYPGTGAAPGEEPGYAPNPYGQPGGDGSSHGDGSQRGA